MRRIPQEPLLDIWPWRPRPPKPPEPTLRPIAIWAVPNAQVRLEAPGMAPDDTRVRTDTQGVANFPRVPGGQWMPSANLFVEAVDQEGVGAPGWQWYGQVIQMPADSDAHQLFAIQATAPLVEPLQIQLPVVMERAGPINPYPPESGWLIMNGTKFRHADDMSLWQGRSCTDFLLFYYWLIGQRAHVEAVLNERQGLGFNCVRVLGMVAWAELNPMFDPKRFPFYYQDLQAFFEMLAARGMRCEFVIFADAQILMDDIVAQSTHAGKVVNVAKTCWNVKLEFCNEPFKNISGGGARAAMLGKQFWRTVPTLMASGAGAGDIAEGDFETLKSWTLDYCTTHDHDRGPEWPRKMKDALEIQRALGSCTWMDEPIGAAEIYQPGYRSNDPHEFQDGAAVLALQTGLGTFHSTNGRNSVLFEPISRTCAEAWLLAFSVIKPEWSTGQYTAGHLTDTCPLQHSDELAMRTFAQILGDQAMAVVVMPKGWTPIAQNGWRIVAQYGYAGNLVLLHR